MTTKTSSPILPPTDAQLPTLGINLTAAGTTQANAFAIPSGQDLSVFTTVASGAGARLPVNGLTLGEEYVVANHGALALLLYPGLGGQIGQAGANAGVSVPAGKAIYCQCINAGPTTSSWLYNLGA